MPKTFFLISLLNSTGYVVLVAKKFLKFRSRFHSERRC